MKQKEVIDRENTRWTCVQAYSGTDGEVSKRIEEKSETDDGFVPIVCTPSGGAQSVRVELPKNWEEMPDEKLLEAIQSAT